MLQSAMITAFKEKSNIRSLFYNGFYFNPNRLVNGNSKLHNILIFDMPAVKTCLNCNDCKNRCYALKAEKQYTNTKIFRETNFFMYSNSPELLKNLITEQLKMAKNINTVRLHSSGDFFSQSYINFWDDIIKMFPNINFYTYTKVEKILDFSNIEKNKNFNLISSFIHGKLNFGSLEYCKELKQKFNTFICPATQIENIKCNKDCKYCIKNKNVCFVEH